MKKYRRSTVLVETRVKAERIYVHNPGMRRSGTRETFGMGFAGLALPLKKQRFLVQCAGSTSHILVLDDGDLIKLLEFKSQGDTDAISRYLAAKFRPIFMGA